MMNIIITGDKGLIGSSLKERLDDNVVKCIDIQDGDNILDMDYKIDNVDILFHLAAHCKINKSVANPELAHVNNAMGTFSVLEFCRKNKIKKIVLFSSSRVLSKEKNPYTASKIYGEELCKAYKQCYGINYIIIRPSTVYGPFDDNNPRLVDIFIRNALENKDLIIYGNPNKKTLDFTYIDDFINGVMLSLKKWNNDYDISGNYQFHVYDLAKMIIKKTNSKSNIIIRPAETAQPQNIKLNITKMKLLGFNPTVCLEEGIDECIKFYKNILLKTN